jgi:hypothetical protein
MSPLQFVYSIRTIGITESKQEMCNLHQFSPSFLQSLIKNHAIVSAVVMEETVCPNIAPKSPKDIAVGIPTNSPETKAST